MTMDKVLIKSYFILVKVKNRLLSPLLVPSFHEKKTLMTFSKGCRHAGHFVTLDAHFAHAIT